MLDANVNNHIFSTKEVIEIQSMYYYQQKDELGFFTLSEVVNEYAYLVAKYISRLWTMYTSFNFEAERNIKIIELGPGTGRFTIRLLNYLKRNNLSVDYTIVDINPYVKSLSTKINAKFYNCSFETFTKGFNTKYDFFILNEALDMWAGNHISVDNDGNEYNVFWRLRDLQTNQLLSKNNFQFYLNPYSSLYWEKVYLNKEKTKINEFGILNSDEFIQIPKNLINFIRLANIGGIIQDYWIDEFTNPLRSGLSREDCKFMVKAYEKEELAIEYIQRLEHALSFEKDSNDNAENKNEKLPLNDTKIWFDSPITPFGFSDVTYTPNINELVDKINSDSYLATVWNFEELANVYDIKLTSNDLDRWINDKIVIVENRNFIHNSLKYNLKA